MPANDISASDFDREPGLDDWRVLLGRIEARYLAPTFIAASDFIRAVADAAELAGHHPDVDLRYPGYVHISVTTHDAKHLTEADVDLARTITTLARHAALTSQPLAQSAVEVAIDALDIDAVRPFWKAVLGYEDEPPRSPGGKVIALVDPLHIGPAFWFQQMDAPR
ncbi:MAG TPA: 4a-hydroxytetrahydrobiopterin dehydratase, partial [Ilumatobacteraceae bacterium]